MENERKPLLMCLDMRNLQGNEFIIEGMDGEMIGFSAKGSRQMMITFNFENFALYVWQNGLTFVGDNDEPVPAFSGIDELCLDLQHETTATRVFHLESRKIFWYVPSARTFINDKGIYKTGDIPDGHYCYEPFGEVLDSELLVKRAVYFRTRIMGYGDAAEFARCIGVDCELYQNYEEGVCQLPQIRDAIVRTFPWVNPDWLVGAI